MRGPVYLLVLVVAGVLLVFVLRGVPSMESPALDVPQQGEVDPTGKAVEEGSPEQKKKHASGAVSAKTAYKLTPPQSEQPAVSRAEQAALRRTSPVTQYSGYPASPERRPFAGVLLRDSGKPLALTFVMFRWVEQYPRRPLPPYAYRGDITRHVDRNGVVWRYLLLTTDDQGRFKGEIPVGSMVKIYLGNWGAARYERYVEGLGDEDHRLELRAPPGWQDVRGEPLDD